MGKGLEGVSFPALIPDPEAPVTQKQYSEIMATLGEISARRADRSPPRAQRRIQFEDLVESSGSGRMAEVREEPMVEYPTEHTEARHPFTKSVICRAFGSILKGSERWWFAQLKQDSIHSFAQLVSQFKRHFMSNRRHKKDVTYLLSLKQGDEEPLKEYVGRFNYDALEVEDINPLVVIVALRAGLKKSEFRNSLNRRTLKTLEELMKRVEEYINQEEAYWDLVAPSYQPTKRQRLPDLRDALTAILVAFQSRGFLKFPPTPKPGNKNVDHSKFCLFHRTPGHDTDDCFTLKDEIENLMRIGCLTKFVQQEGARRAGQDVRSRGEHSSLCFERPGYNRKSADDSRRPPRSPVDGGNVVGVIHTIVGGFSLVGRTSSKRKREPDLPVVTVNASEAARFPSCSMSLRRVHPRSPNLGARTINVYLGRSNDPSSEPDLPVLAVKESEAARFLSCGPSLRRVYQEEMRGVDSKIPLSKTTSGL
ncbi:Retrovirus-related Pol polyprotein [Quillaja saponaria]|uniref:Retrovirus-related Pol polyprotein n=1 Tax=Quillaja saponaria TaxID=32244 RepID=A0AAD7LN45_QUISA|nr:Retrovirus-related Pol polyprotein [Quillaja saponaria]